MTIAATSSTSATRYDRSAATASAMALAAPHSKHGLTREHWLEELQALLRVHEPTRVHCAVDLLNAYEGMERELVQCYRHYYTGEGGFRVIGGSAESSGPTFSLPREAIDTYLRVKLRARRSHSFASKGDGVRDVELAASFPTTTSTRLPRQRAASASAVHTQVYY